MRAFSRQHPTKDVEAAPDTVQTLLLAGGTAQALDWANSTVGSSDVGADIVRFAGITTAGVTLNFNVNLVSTHAVAPASGTSITTGTTVGSTGNSIPVQGSRYFQIPAWSTGYSVIALTSGYVSAEVWHQ